MSTVSVSPVISAMNDDTASPTSATSGAFDRATRGEEDAGFENQRRRYSIGLQEHHQAMWEAAREAIEKNTSGSSISSLASNATQSADAGPADRRDGINIPRKHVKNAAGELGAVPAIH